MREVRADAHNENVRDKFFDTLNKEAIMSRHQMSSSEAGFEVDDEHKLATELHLDRSIYFNILKSRARAMMMTDGNSHGDYRTHVQNVSPSWRAKDAEFATLENGRGRRMEVGYCEKCAVPTTNFVKSSYRIRVGYREMLQFWDRLVVLCIRRASLRQTIYIAKVLNIFLVSIENLKTSLSSNRTYT